MRAASRQKAVFFIACVAAVFHDASLDAVNFDFVPDVVNYSPESVLKVTFREKEVAVGNELTPTDVKTQPTVLWSAEGKDYYSLFMTDPDAPSRLQPTFREFLHWLVVNIPGSDVAAGEELAQYVGSGPPKGTDLHRYVLLLFKQPGRLTFEGELRRNNTSRVGRKKFSIQKFVDLYDLKQPAAAGNFYLAQWDEYVPILHKQLSGGQD